jgi:hypothetical protein
VHLAPDETLAPTVTGGRTFRLTRLALVSVAQLAGGNLCDESLVRVEEGAPEAERLEDFAAGDVGERGVVQPREHQPERDVAQVAVDDVRAGRGLQRLARD